MGRNMKLTTKLKSYLINTMHVFNILHAFCLRELNAVNGRALSSSYSMNWKALSLSSSSSMNLKVLSLSSSVNWPSSVVFPARTVGLHELLARMITVGMHKQLAVCKCLWFNLCSILDLVFLPLFCVSIGEDTLFRFCLWERLQIRVGRLWVREKNWCGAWVNC